MSSAARSNGSCSSSEQQIPVVWHVFTMSSVHSTGIIKKAVSWKYFYCILLVGELSKGSYCPVPLHFSEDVYGVVFQSVFFIPSAEVSELASTFLQKQDLERWNVLMTFDWLQAQSSMEELKIYLTDFIFTSDMYINRIFGLWNLFPRYFSAYWTARKTHPGGRPSALVTCMWKIWDTQFKQYAFSVFANPSL